MGAMAVPRHTLDQLAVLDAIDRTGSFARAAKELHRVPSAISYSVRSLEEALELELFDRTGHRAELTHAGRRILELGRAVLDGGRALEAMAQELSRGWEPELRVVVDGALPLEPVFAALRIFSEERIPTRVRMVVEYQEGVLDRFRHDDADIMLILDSDESVASSPTHMLPPLEMVLVCAPTHPVASGEPLDEHLQILVLDSARRFAETPREAFIGTPDLLHVSDFEAKRQALLQSVGFGWMPQHQVANDLAQGALQLVEREEGNRWTYAPRAIERTQPPIGRAAQRFLEHLLEQVHQIS